MRENHNDVLPELIESATEAIPINASIEATRDPLQYLVELLQEWKTHSTFLARLKGYFTGLEETIELTGLRVFEDRYIHLENIQSMLTQHAMDTKEISESLVWKLRRMLLRVQRVEGFDAKQPSFAELEVSCRDKAKQLIERCDCGGYFREAEKFLKEQIREVCQHFDGILIAETINLVIKVMIETHMEKLAHMEASGIVYMMTNGKFEDLQRMYSLMRRLPHGPTLIAEVITQHIRAVGERIVGNIKTPPVLLVQSLLDEKDKYDNIIAVVGFNNDLHIRNTVYNSFKYIVNLSNRSPQFISLFLDSIVRKRLKGVIEDNVNILLDKVMVFFQMLQNKDVFEYYYKLHLTKRLLSGKCDETERRLMLKFERECGWKFMSRMHEDLLTSQAVMQDFHAAETADGPELYVKILRKDKDCWSLQQSDCNVALPPELVEVSNRFLSHYQKTQKLKYVWWEFKMGTANLIATFGDGKKHELKVSTYQMCILTLFNDAERLSFKEIKQATQIPTSELRWCLQSLSSVKGKNILRMEKGGESINEDTLFYFNNSFSSCKKHIDITPSEQPPEVQPDYSLEILTTVVRIMKFSKDLTHDTLINQVMNKWDKFKRPLPLVKHIKKEIEYLIDRECLKRVPGGYQYLPE